MANPSPLRKLLPLLLLAPLPFIDLGPLWGGSESSTPTRRSLVEIDGSSWQRLDVRANSYTRSTQDEPSLAMAEDGSTVLVWQSRRQQNASDGVYGQRFAASGRPIGGEQTLNAWQRTDQNQPAIVCSDKVHWVAWQSQGQDGEGSGIYLRRLDRVGEGRISASPKGDQYGVVLAAGRRGGVVAAWMSAEVGKTVARMRGFDREGMPTGPEIELGRARGVTLANARDHVVAVWQDAEGGLLAQGFDAGAQAMSSPIAVADDAGTDIEPALCATEGGFALVWMAMAPGAARYEVRLRRLDEKARPEASSVVVSRDASWNSGATVASLGEGRLAIAWNEEDANSDASRVTLRLVDAQGALGANYEIGRGRLRIADGRPGIVAGREGRLALAWAGDADLGDSSGVHLTLLIPGRGEKPMAQNSRGERPHRTSGEEAPADPTRARFEDLGIEATFVTESAASPQGQHTPPVFEKPDPLLKNWGKGPGILGNSGDKGFAAFSTGFRKLTPPDPHMACGPKHVVSIVNAGIAFWKKDGTRTFLANFNGTGGFWTSVGGNGFVFDPEVHWDPMAQRFIAMANERNGSSSYFLIAISDDTDPNGKWHKYRIDVTAVGGSSIDSPNLGIDDKALYLTADMYGNKRQYLIYIMDKKPLLAGKAPGVAKATNLSRFSAGLPVMWGKAPTMYMIQHDTSTTVKLFAIKNPLTSPALVSTTLKVPFYSTPTRLTQKGTTRRITTFNPRFWSCVWRKGSLWACHHQGSPVKARWYEIQTGNWPTSGAPKLVQSGDVNAGAGKHASFNAISVDESGNALMVFASCSPSDYLSIARAWRAASDPKGTMRPAVLIQSNTSAYTGSRWGDYSQAAADPAAANTIWYTHELAPTSSWTTWIARKKTSIFGSDLPSLSAAAGGTIQFTLDNPSQKNKPYLIIGSLSGTKPGFKLGSLQVPINLDSFTTLVLGLTTSPAFPGFFGTLDADGNALASMNLPPLPASLIGKTMHFAFVQDFTTWSFASPPLPITITK